jgi:LuxR family transcriptional regulator, maltose regulon positive regulatory protein
LITAIDRAVRSRLTMVIGPPGYGKTVLLSQWAAARRSERVRWLSLGPGHNDPATLGLDLVAALARPERGPTPALPGLLAPDGRRWDERFLSALLDDIWDLPRTVLVLDDVHVLECPAAVEELATLIGHASSTLHVVMISRGDPPSPFFRFGLSDELIEVRTNDLAFTFEEAVELLGALVGRDLTDEQVRTLVTRTEGWPMGLRSAARALRAATAVDHAVGSFDGADPLVAQYFTEQVLGTLKPHTVELLLRTSVLERMSGPVIDFLTGTSGGQALLEDLERRSLFVVPLGGQLRSFRHHRLFRSMLRSRLHAEDPEGERLLLRQAAEWHLARRMVTEGVGYLCDAREWDAVVDAAYRHGPMLHVNGRSATVAAWMEAVPEQVRRHSVSSQLLHAAALIASGAPAPADGVLDRSAGLAGRSDGASLVRDLLRSWAALEQGIPARAVPAAARVLERVAAADPRCEFPNVLGLTGTIADIAAGAHLVHGVGLLYQGETNAARTSLAGALGQGSICWQIVAFGALAVVDVWEGLLASGAPRAARALAIAEQVGCDRHPVTAPALLALAQICREQGNLEEAARYAADAAVLIGAGADPVMKVLVSLEHAALIGAVDGPAAGLAMLEANGADELDLPALHTRRRVVEARLLLAAGEVDRAATVINDAPVETADVAACRVRLAVEQHDTDAARALLDQWPNGGGRRATSQRQLWLAIVQQLDGDESAYLRMAAVVREAEMKHDVGLFRTAGSHAANLIRVLHQSNPNGLLRTLLEHPDTPTMTSSSEGLAEPLTERERMVLALLPSRLSNAGIAERLGVSINTVKSHLQHLYQKLGVSSRSDAIVASERMGLL